MIFAGEFVAMIFQVVSVIEVATVHVLAVNRISVVMDLSLIMKRIGGL